VSDTHSPDSTPRRDFIRELVIDDIATGRFGRAPATRFPPEPNGFLHIAREFGGTCNLRFDDTNPFTEDVKYVESIKQDVKWLGFDWDGEYYASDYFEQLYAIAERLVEQGRAYVDSQSEEEIRTNRGTVTTPGVPGPYRDRAPAENLELLRRMKAGEFADGAHVLRARIDLAHPNMIMRDPLLLRIRRDAHHYRRGSEWKIYPLYDFAHGLSDALEGITRSLCTLEFKDNRDIYEWLVAAAGFPSPPTQIEFARLELDYTVLSKRKLLRLVNDGHVKGWDDPRMPTIAGLRRRGVRSDAIRAFADTIGVARKDARVEIATFEHAVRNDLNMEVPRVLCVLNPLKVVITNYPEGQVDLLEGQNYPHDVPKTGTRDVPFSRELWVDRDDFMEDPPKKFYRLAPGREVRLRFGYLITCNDVIKDANGSVTELHCTYDPETRSGNAPDGRKVQGTIHWVSAPHALNCEVRLYDRLFTQPDPDDVPEGEDFLSTLNPVSLVVIADAKVEPSVANDPIGTRYQFERTGYFMSETEDSTPERLVFNRIVSLRDSWAKETRKGG